MFNYNFKRKILPIIFVTMFVSLTGSVLFVQGSGTVSCSGHVYKEGGGALSGATVRLYVMDYDVPKFSETTTSSTGYYSLSRSFSQPSPVEIAVLVSKDGYNSESWGDTVYPGSYSHDFTLSLEDPPPDPSVSWVSPASGAVITFPPSSNEFSFTYSAQDIDYTRLYLGPSGASPTIQFGSDWTDEGSSISKTVDIGAYADDFHGLVRADLRSYVSGSIAATATRTFNFSKQITIETEFLEEGMEDLGSQLYLILYDPPGDESYSTFTEQTSVTRTNSISIEAGVSVEVELKGSLFNIGTDAKFGVDVSYGYEHEWSQTDIDTIELSSSLNTAERELVGPGYGDLYWGELEVFCWEIYIDTITYADGTIVYTDPIIYCGIDYSEDVLVSHQTAPSSWLQLNPNINAALYDDPSIVELTQINSEIQGGTGYIEVTHEEISTTSNTHTFSLGLSYSTKVKLGVGSTEVEVSLDTQFQHDTTQSDSVKTTYHIQDDDSGDYFHYDVGTDKRFGVPIFRNTPNENPLFQSKSSSPWEYNTRDYLPPETTYPVITLNTDGDGYAPSEDDTPLVELTLTDEADIAEALLIYSNNGGSTWNTIAMEERLNDPNSWYANLPGHEHGTEVLWYIFATDTNDNSITVLNVDDEEFSYTVVNRPCDVFITAPNGGETFEDTVLIEWSGSDPDGDSLTYSIGYRIDSGSWTLIATGLTNNSYLWDISGFEDSDSVSVIVYANDGYGGNDNDDCDFSFSIDNVDIPEVTLTAPLASFTYQGILSIAWTTDDPDDYITGFSLYYSVTSGDPTWILIDDTLTSDLLTYDWDTNSIVYSATARVKIVVENALAETVEGNSGIFTIDNRPTIDMNLINPNGGETITGVHTISWNVDYTNELIEYEVMLEYSYNGTSWEVIATELTGTTYEWDTIPLTEGTNYRVRATLTASYLSVSLDTVVDISEGTFTIDNSPDIQVSLLNPDGGETIEYSCVINWEVDYTNPNIVWEVKLEYSINGSSWIEIATGLTNESYSWNVRTLASGTNYRIRVTLTASYLGLELDPVVDISATTFEIDNHTDMQMNLISPNGGETIDDSCLVSWNIEYDNPDIVYEIKLEYSFNGSSWVVIASGLTGESYSWNTTALASGINYRLRITLTASYLDMTLDPIVDVSESTFAIIHPTPSPTSVTSIPLYTVFIALATISTIALLKVKKRR